MSMFPIYEGPSFGPNDIENHLISLQTLGWTIGKASEIKYVVTLSDDSRIEVRFSNQKWFVFGYKNGVTAYAKSATAYTSFLKWFYECATELGFDLGNAPLLARLSPNTPLTNLENLASVSKGHLIDGIFDPYFEDRSIANLKSMMNLGLEVTNIISVLCTVKVKNSLTQTVIDSFKLETGKALDIRYTASAKEHRRFLRTAQNSSIIVGCSLNDLNKNEAIRLEHSPEDRIFFDSEWANGIPK